MRIILLGNDDSAETFHNGMHVEFKTVRAIVIKQTNLNWGKDDKY